MTKCKIAIIGAGPYGLSVAAHLRAHAVDFRIFGHPMHTWSTQMPKGMRLKSEGFASSLYDPDSSFTLRRYCQERNLGYSDIGKPVPLETFIAYGLEFQKRLVPELENKLVASIDRLAHEYRITFQDGTTVTAQRIVVAVGISHFGYLPPILAALPEEFVTHSSRHSDLESFHGREVAVVGAGASALDLAALLHQAGASVQLIARKPVIKFHDPPPGPPNVLQRLRRPVTGIGPGWKLFLCTNAPWAFRHLPESYRLEAVRKILGPAPGWFIKEQVVGKMPFHLGANIEKASVQNHRVVLELTNGDGSQNTLAVDHVIAATGFKVDLRRLRFLNPDLRGAIRSVENAPVLSSNFESSLPGLYFVGTSAANTFGPLMRFAYGAGYTARKLSKHLAKSSRHPSSRGSSAEVRTVNSDEVVCQ